MHLVSLIVESHLRKIKKNIHLMYIHAFCVNGRVNSYMYQMQISSVVLRAKLSKFKLQV